MFVVQHGHVVDTRTSSVDGSEDTQATNDEFLREDEVINDRFELAAAEGGKRDELAAALLLC